MHKRHTIETANGCRWDIVEKDDGALEVRFVEGPGGATALTVEPRSANVVTVRPLA